MLLSGVLGAAKEPLRRREGGVLEQSLWCLTLGQDPLLALSVMVTDPPRYPRPHKTIHFGSIAVMGPGVWRIPCGRGGELRVDCQKLNTFYKFLR